MNRVCWGRMMAAAAAWQRATPATPGGAGRWGIHLFDRRVPAASAPTASRRTRPFMTSGWVPHAASATLPSTEVWLGDLVVSPAAVRRMQALRSKYPDRLALRVTVDSGGCSGFKYKLTLDTAPPGAEDVVVQVGDVTVVTDAASMDLIRGSTIDYVEEMARTAFVVAHNPQAATGCSCGTSFAAKEG